MHLYTITQFKDWSCDFIEHIESIPNLLLQSQEGAEEKNHKAQSLRFS